MSVNEPKWMVRTSDNVLAGPYSLEDIKQLAEDRSLLKDDELCHANQYWFYLHDQEEVRTQLGFHLKFAASDDPHEEVTQTEQESGETKTLIDVSDHLDPSDLKDQDDIELELDTSEESSFEEGVLENRAFREIKKPQKMTRKYQPVHKPHTSGDQPVQSKNVEGPTLYKWAVIFLLGLVVFSLLALLKLLNK